MEKNWFYVIFGGFLEIFWVLCLKKSENFHHFFLFHFDDFARCY